MEKIVLALSVKLVQPTYIDVEEFTVELVSLQVVGSKELLQLVKKVVHEVMVVSVLGEVLLVQNS